MSRTTDSSERSSLNPAGQLRSSESSLPEVDLCEPSETIREAEPEQLLPDSNIKTEPQADANNNSIAKLSQQIKSYKKRRRNELDILFTTRGSSDVEPSVSSAYQIETEAHDRAKRIKRVEDSRSSSLIEEMRTSSRIEKQRTLQCQSSKEKDDAVSRKHGPSRWRQRIDNPLFCTPDSERNLKGSDLSKSPLASAESPRGKALSLPRQRSEQNHTPATSVVTRAQYKDLIARSSQEPINGDKGPFDSSCSRISSSGSRRRQNLKNATRPRKTPSNKGVSEYTSLDYPRSWDKATFADKQLVEMRDRGVFWNVVRDTWQDTTERQIAPETLKIRHSYLASLRSIQSNKSESGAHIEEGPDARSVNAGQSHNCPSKLTRAKDSERINSSDGDDDFLDDNLEQSSESEESSDSNGQHWEDSELERPVETIRDHSSHNMRPRILPSTSVTFKHVPASQRNNSSIPVSSQATSTNPTRGSSSWKLASRQAKLQNPLEKYYNHLKIVFKGRSLVTGDAEPGTAVNASELAASMFKNISINTDAPEPSDERPVSYNGIQSIRKEPLDKQNA